MKKLEDQKPVLRGICKDQILHLVPRIYPTRIPLETICFSRLINGVDTDLNVKLKEELVKYLMGLPDNIGKRALKKGLSKEDQQDIDNIV